MLELFGIIGKYAGELAQEGKQVWLAHLELLQDCQRDTLGCHACVQVDEHEAFAAAYMLGKGAVQAGNRAA